MRVQIWWFLYIPSEPGVCTHTHARAFVTWSGVYGEVSMSMVFVVYVSVGGLF